MQCPFCSHPLDQKRIGFRDLCEKCHAALHSCQACKFFCPGRANDCLIPGTEWVADRSANNFCEEFSLKGFKPEAKGDDPLEKARRLLGGDS